MLQKEEESSKKLELTLKKIDAPKHAMPQFIRNYYIFLNGLNYTP